MPADPRIVSGDELMTLIEAAFGRLDIALADSNTLRRAKRSQRDQLLHWTAWLALHPQRGLNDRHRSPTTWIRHRTRRR